MPHLRLPSPTPAPGRRHRTGRHPGGGPGTISINTYDIYVPHLVGHLSLSLSPPASLGSLLCAVTAIRKQCFGRPLVCLRVATVVQGGTSGDWRSGSGRPERVGPVRCLPAFLWASGCSRTVPGRLGAGRAEAELRCGTWAGTIAGHQHHRRWKTLGARLPSGFPTSPGPTKGRNSFIATV